MSKEFFSDSLCRCETIDIRLTMFVRLSTALIFILVMACESSGNKSDDAQTNIRDGQTKPNDGSEARDTQSVDVGPKPVGPTGFRDRNVNQNAVTLAWENETPGTQTEVFIGDDFLAETDKSGLNVTGLTKDTNYLFRIRSKSALGAVSDFSYTINVRTGLYPRETLMEDTGYTVPREPERRLEPYKNTQGLDEVKITDKDDAPWNGRVQSLEGAYPRHSRWNRDNSYIGTDYPYHLMDGDTYELDLSKRIWKRSWWSAKVGEEDASWSANNNRLSKRVQGSDVFSRTFDRYDTDKGSLLPTAEAGFSFDMRYVALEGHIGEQLYCISYDTEEDKVISETAVDPVYNGWLAASPKGDYIIHFVQNYPSGVGNGTFVYRNDSDFTPVDYGDGRGNDLQKGAGDGGHADFAITMQGNQALVMRSQSRMYMFVLETGQQKDLLGGTLQIGHVSGRSLDQPGWAYIDDRNGSSYDSLPADSVRRKMYRKISAVKLDENSTPENIRIRTYATLSRDASHTFGASPDNSGQKVSFMNYKKSGRDYLEMYVAQQKEALPFEADPNFDSVDASTR